VHFTKLGLKFASGALSVIKTCKHKQKGYQRAVKLINLTNHQKIAKNEVEILVGLDHQNITSFKEFFLNETHYFLVFELNNGSELLDKLIELSKFKEADSRKYIDQLLQGINYLHQSFVCHRDIKFENIMLSNKDNDARIVLLGFGEASAIWTDDDGNETPFTTPLPGSIIYHAPETFKENAEYFKAVDLWAVGVVSYTMICGVPPFIADTNEDIKKAIMLNKPNFPADFSEQARSFIVKAFTYDPSSRPSAANILQHPWLRG